MVKFGEKIDYGFTELDTLGIGASAKLTKVRKLHACSPVRGVDIQGWVLQDGHLGRTGSPGCRN